MKIALFSDIHANLPALEAVFQDMDKRNPEAIYCLGDLVGYAPWPNEVVAKIQERRIPTIFGNYDQGIGLSSDDCGCAYKTEEEKAMGAISISYTNQIVGDDARNYLKSLPAHLEIKFQFERSNFNLLMVHGSPRKVNEYLFEDRPEASLLRIMQHANADIMAFGHTHKPFHKIIADDQNEQKTFKHAINIGSVGKPKDGDPRACYVIIDVDNNSNMSNANTVNVEFIRVEYDVEKAAKAVENSPLPNPYAQMLRNAY